MRHFMNGFPARTSIRLGIWALGVSALIGADGFGLGRLQAGGLYINEFATPSLGVAGAGAEALADNASTAFAFHNPAGMTRLKGNQVQGGAGVLIGDVEFSTDDSTPFGGGDGGDQAGLAPIVGGHGVLSATDDLKFGMSVFSVTGASLDPDDDWSGRFQMTDIELLSVSLNPSVAYRLNDWLSLGGGFVAMYADLKYELAAPPGGIGQVEVNGDDWAYGYNFGALVELSPKTRVGVIYASKVEPNFSGDLKVKTGGGASFAVNSNVEFTFPQLVRVGIYHDLNHKWALLGTVGWEDWSNFDDLTVSVQRGSASIPTEWRDTYHFSAGVHYRPAEDWLLQAGATYDTSPVSDANRTADLPADRQIRVAVGAQYDLNERMTVGGALEYIDFGDSRIDNPALLRGDYSDNRAVVFALNLSYRF